MGLLLRRSWIKFRGMTRVFLYLLSRVTAIFLISTATTFFAELGTLHFRPENAFFFIFCYQIPCKASTTARAHVNNTGQHKRALTFSFFFRYQYPQTDLLVTETTSQSKGINQFQMESENERSIEQTVIVEAPLDGVGSPYSRHHWVLAAALAQ